MFFPFPPFLSCSHVLVLISPITKTDIRDLCGAFHLNIRDRIAQWREQPHWNRMQVYLSVWIMPGSNPDSCLLIVCFQTCQWSDGLDVLVLSVPFLGVSLPPPPFFFSFLGSQRVQCCFPLSMNDSCDTHLVVYSITKADIRDPCGVFQLNISDRIA